MNMNVSPAGMGHNGGPDLHVEWVRPKLYQKQLDAIFTDKRYSVVEASTKAGKTVGCAAWLVEQAFLCGAPGREFWWVAPILAQAKIAFKRIKRFLTRMAMDQYGSVHEVFTVNESGIITLMNGSVIVFKGADNPDSLYGEDVWAAVIDESTRCKEEAWHAIRSTLTATEGKARVIGNVRGKKNWAYKLARKAEQEMKAVAEGHKDDTVYHYAKLTANDAVAGGVLKQSEIEDAASTLGERIFNELYMAEPSDDGGNPFGLPSIAKCVRNLSNQPTVAWGWDLAKSHDWTVGIGLDRHGDVTRFERWQGLWSETVTRIAAITDAPALVDSTGVGDPILEQLQAIHSDRFEGYKFNTQSKQRLMEGLAADIQQGSVGFPQGIILDELEEFEFQYTKTGVIYSAPTGYHDDCVCALALARQRQRTLALVNASGFRLERI